MVNISILNSIESFITFIKRNYQNIFSCTYGVSGILPVKDNIFKIIFNIYIILGGLVYVLLQPSCQMTFKKIDALNILGAFL